VGFEPTVRLPVRLISSHHMRYKIVVIKILYINRLIYILFACRQILDQVPARGEE